MRPGVSPRGFLVTAALIAAAFGAAHALGWREETRFLSGTPAVVAQGALYALLYFAFVVLAPALVMGSGVLALLDRLAGSTSATERRPDV